MVRSVGIAAVVMGLAWTGLALAQSSSPTPPGTSPPRQRYITVREQGKPPQRCKLLKSWREPNGISAYQVQAVNSGEIMTIVSSVPSSGSAHKGQAMFTHIFHWGADNQPPEGAPMPPSAANASLPASPPAPQVHAPAPLAQPALSPVQPAKPAAPTLVQSAPTPRPTAQPVVLPKPKPKPEPISLVQAPAPSRPQTLPEVPPALLSKPKDTDAPAQPKPDVKSTPFASEPTIKPVEKPAAKLVEKPAAKPVEKPAIKAAEKPAVVQQPIGKPPVCDCTPAVSPQPRLVPTACGTVPGPNACNSCCCQPPCNAGCKPSCNSCCCQSSCVCGTPSPLRQSWIGRLFKPHPPCDAVVHKPAPTPPAAAAKPTPPATVKAVTEPPRPGDWRESWGKIEPWKGDTKAEANKPVDKPADKPARRVTKAPVKMDPPKQPDPLKDPAWYGEVALKQKPANSKIVVESSKPAPPPAPEKTAVARSEPKPLPPLSPPPSKEAPKPIPAAQPLPPTVAAPPPPMQPIQPRGRVVQLPADEPNAFAPATPPPPPPGSAQQQQDQPRFNAFDRDDGSPPPRGSVPAMAGAPQGPPRMGGPAMGPMAMPRPPMGPIAMPRPPMGPMPMPPRPPMGPSMPADSGVPSGMANAFTVAGTRRPIPADFGGTPQEPNGFGEAAQWTGSGSPPQAYAIANSGMMPRRQGGNPLMNVPPASAAGTARAGGTPVASSAGTNVPQLLATLKESMYPSQREWAAEQLSELNGRKQPQVVEGLTKTARDDLAATVRAACVRALGRMQVNSHEVIALGRDLKNDRDPRVRQEADEMLNALGAAPRQDSGVQQASHK